MKDKAMEQYRNYGIEILRVLLCFGVISVHFCPYAPVSLITRNYPVPVFMMISFMFLYGKITDTAKIKNQLKRIFIPYITYPIIYIYIYIITQIIFKLQFNPLRNNLMAVLWQFHTGHSFISPLWFLWAQMILIIFFALLFKVVKNHTVLNLTMFMLFILSIFLQYSEINYKIFGGLKNEIRYPFGRLMEMMPFCIIGLLLGKYQIIKKLEKYKIQSWLISCVLFALFRKVNFSVFVVQNQFHYAGVNVILLSVLFLLSFALLPIEKIFCICPNTKEILCFITKYTLGIYCMHVIVGQYLEACMIRFNFQMTSMTLKGLLIYIICYVFCFIVDKIPLGFCKKLVN